MCSTPALRNPIAKVNPASPSPIKPIFSWLLISVHVAAAVTEDHLPGDHLRVVSSQECDQGREVFGTAPLLDRLVHHHPIEGLLVGMGFSTWSRYHAWSYGVDRNVVVAHFLGHHASHSHHRTFGSDVSHLTRIGQKVGARGDVDNATVLALFEQWIRGPGNEEVANVVNLNEAIDFFVRQRVPGLSA